MDRADGDAMGRIVTWIGKNGDGLFALLVASLVAVLTWLDAVDVESTNSATLLVLAVLSVALLRQRSWQQSVDRQVEELAHVHTDLDGQLSAIQDHINVSQVALNNLSMVRTLNGAEIQHALREGRRDTDKWLFKGGTGTYMRAVTLPECVDNARRGQRALLVRMEIVDATNTDTCERYARFRRSLRDVSDGTGEAWTLDRVRKESFASLLAAEWWRQRYDLLDVEIALSHTMTTLRWDLSASGLIITQEDPRWPALLIEHGRFYYDRLSTELRTSHEQARKVPLERARDIQLSDEPTVDETERFFAALGMALPHTFGKRDVQDIIRKAVKPKNPYEIADHRSLHA